METSSPFSFASFLSSSSTTGLTAMQTLRKVNIFFQLALTDLRIFLAQPSKKRWNTL